MKEYFIRREADLIKNGLYTKELVDALKICGYYHNDTNVNCTVEGGKIVGKLKLNIADALKPNDYVRKYFKELERASIEKYYSVIGKHNDSNVPTVSQVPYQGFFPYGIKEDDIVYDENERLSKFVVDITSEVALNLKFHLAIKYLTDIRGLTATHLQKAGGVSAEKAFEFLRNNAVIDEMPNPSYLYSVTFGGNGVQKLYVKHFENKLKKCGIKDPSLVYTIEGNKLYVKNFTDANIVKSLSVGIVERVALDFDTPGKEESKVGNYKNVLSDLILEWTKKHAGEGNGVVIAGYGCDKFIDEERRKYGHDFALVPGVAKSDGKCKSLSIEDVKKINDACTKEGIGSILTDITDQTENTRQTEDTQHYKIVELVYGISNKQFASILPRLMEAPIGYNETNKSFEYIVPLNERKVEEALNSDTKTPPSKRNLAVKRSLSNSPRKDKDGSHLRNSESAASFDTSWDNQGNNLAVKNGNVMSTSADSGLGSNTNVSQSGELDVVPLPQKNTTDAKHAQVLTTIAEVSIEKSTSKKNGKSLLSPCNIL